jgi:hypothetical protein
MIDRIPRTALACALAVTLNACGGGDSDTDEAAPAAEAADTEAASEAPQVSEAAPSAGTVAPVTVAEIEGWKKGMSAELELVRAAGTKLKEAKTADDTLSAMMGLQEMATWEAGAKAADLDVERYKFVSSELSAAVSYLTPQLGGIDTTILSPAQRQELRESNAAQLKQMEERVPAEVVQALRPRAVDLRKQNLELAAERLKSAGV